MIDQQATAAVNTIRVNFLQVNVVTRSQGEAPFNPLPRVKEDPLDWDELDDTTRTTRRLIQEEQQGDQLPNPETLMRMQSTLPEEDASSLEEREWLA